MKALLSVLLFFSAQVFAKDYLYKWNNQAGIDHINQAIYLLEENQIELPQNGYITNIKPELAFELRKTKAFLYLEEDREIKAPIEKVNRHLNQKNYFETNRGWSLDKVGAKAAWRKTQGHPSVIVAFCDSGINSSVPELRGKVLRGWNFVGGNSNTSHYSAQGDPNTHGTSVASFIAANYNPFSNTGGVAPRVTLLPGLITNAQGSTSTVKITSCIRWAARQGAKVINVSISGSGSSAAWDAARYAFNRGAVVVWSSGNSNRYLSARNQREMLVVGGTDRNNFRYRTDNGSHGSNYGFSIDVVAPGEDIFKPWGIREKTNGTSYSAPIVSGIAALLFSRNPTLSAGEVIRIIKMSARNIGRSDYFGAGLVNANSALRYVR